MSNSSKYSGKGNGENLSKEEYKQTLEDWQKKNFEEAYQPCYENAETVIKNGIKITAEPDIEYKRGSGTAGCQFGNNQAIKDNLSKWKSGELPEVEPRAEETKMKGKDKIFEVVDDREAYEKRAEEKREWMRKQNQKFLEQRGL